MPGPSSITRTMTRSVVVRVEMLSASILTVPPCGMASMAFRSKLTKSCTNWLAAGSSVLANAQPILAGYHEGPLALAHNGNLTNAAALRSDLVAKGSIFQTSSDSEVLIHLIARSEAREPEDQLLDALERVEGAYSLVV